MKSLTRFALLFVCLFAGFFSGTVAAQTSTSAKKTESPAVQMRTLVQQTLAKNPYYSPGYLISRRDVDALFSQLLKMGLTDTEDQEDLAECVLPDSSFLVGRLKTPVGRAFMKQLASHPELYDRLERLSWTPDGRQLIDSFIRTKDITKLQQLKTSEQLAKLSKRLAADASTADFEFPTSRVHTADELIVKLEEIIAAKNAAE